MQFLTQETDRRRLSRLDLTKNLGGASAGSPNTYQDIGAVDLVRQIAQRYVVAIVDAARQR